jgi:RHS repeat-associated protein
VEFSWAGLPIEVITPPNAAGVRSLTTYVFDNRMNLLCERDPVANAWGGKHCTSATDAQGNYNDLDPDGFSTRYTYFAQAPYRLRTVKHPAPTSAAPRLQESYSYDSGSSFSGLWAEVYDVSNLADLPNDEYVWTDFDEDWLAGNPPGANGGDTFSIRLTGYLDVTDWTGPRTAKFRVWSNDGVSLSVAGANLLDCFGQSQGAADFNCGTNQDVKKKIWPPGSGLVPFEVEYSELTGGASLNLRWDGGDGGAFVVPAATRFQPNLGLVTTKTYQKVDGATTDLWEEIWTYPTDDLKARRLPQDHHRKALPSAPDYATRTTYDAYGQPLTVTDHYGTTEAATITNVWTNATPPWDTGKVSCLTQTTDPTGAVTKFECSRAGDTTKQIVQVRAQSPQAAQTRTTTTAYDSLGRPVTVTGPSGQESITSYDLAGRVEQTRNEITDGVFAQTDFAYDHAGHLLTETLPDPDRTGPLARPVVTHAWNWADLGTSMTDARGKTWSTGYDQLSREISRTSPLEAVSSTTYLLGSSTNRVVADAPAGASVTTDLDVLGRTTSETLEAYNSTTYAYDVLGNLTQTTDPAGVATKQTFNNLSELTSSVQFFGTGSAATTTYSYDVAGRLQQVDGPRPDTDANDRITYDYDPVGRLTSSQYEGVTLPSSTTKASVSVTYDDAGERVRVMQPLKTGIDMTRDWTYDLSGRVATYADARGTTMFTHNLAGWPTEADDPRPSLVLYQGYDDLGRRICRHTAACTQTTTGAETYAYDAAGNITQAKNANVTFDVTYDDDGRLWKTFRDGSGTPETTYSYQASTASLTSISDAGGTTAFTYNAADQLLTIDDPFVTGTPVTTYTYDPANGRQTTRTDAQANLRWERAYEANTGRLDAQVIKDNTSGATLASFDLGYDAAGNVTSKASSVFSNPANGTWSYTYDGASRLAQATGPNATGASTTYDYAYDGGGNRILDKETTGSVVRNLTTTYDAAGLPTSATDAATGETVSYAHDQIGNLTGIDSSVPANDWTHAYDPYSRLTCAVQGSDCSSGSTRVLFTMDAIDRALTRTKGSDVTSLTYRGIAETVAKKVEGSATTTYAHTGGAPLAEKTGTNTSFYLRDTHGDVVGLASTAAANQGTSAFDPWGKSLATTGQSTFLGYQGDMTDPDTKQTDMGTRWYAAGLGRFTARDVIFGELTSPMTLNQHVYGGLNPITMWDPTGMGQCTMAGECVTTTASGGAQAVGGNPGAANHPMHNSGGRVHSGASIDAGRAADVTPRPPRPDPMVRDPDYAPPRVPRIEFDFGPLDDGEGSPDGDAAEYGKRCEETGWPRDCSGDGGLDGALVAWVWADLSVGPSFGAAMKECDWRCKTILGGIEVVTTTVSLCAHNITRYDDYRTYDDPEVKPCGIGGYVDEKRRG